MTLRQEIFTYINDIPDSKLVALKPLLFALADDTNAIENDLTEEEQALVTLGMTEYDVNPDSFIPLDMIN